MSLNIETPKIKGHRNVIITSITDEQAMSKAGAPYFFFELKYKEGDKEHVAKLMKRKVDNNPLLGQQLNTADGNKGQPFHLEVIDGQYGEDIVAILPTHKPGELPPLEKKGGFFREASYLGNAVVAAAIALSTNRTQPPSPQELNRYAQELNTLLKGNKEAPKALDKSGSLDVPPPTINTPWTN